MGEALFLPDAGYNKKASTAVWPARPESQEEIIRMKRTLLFLAILATAHGQDLAVSTNQVSFRMVEAGPLPPRQTFTVTASRAWQARLSDPEMLSLNPGQGTTTATVTLSPVDWWFARRAPGTHEQTLTVAETATGGATLTVRISLTVIAKSPLPQISYLAGPNGCTDATNLLPNNAAICTVPGDGPNPSFAPPKPGRSYVDPNFGGLVRVIAGPLAQHGYSTPTAISANSKYALITREWAAPDAVHLLTGKTAYGALPIGIEGPLWDAQDENLIYSVSGSSVRRLNIATRQSVTVVTHTSAISTGGTSEISKENWIAFFSESQRQVCALDLSLVKTYCGTHPTTSSVDFVTMAKGVDRESGKRYVVMVPRSGAAFFLYSVNAAAERLDLEGRGPENITFVNGNRNGVCESGETCVNGSHADTMEDSQGLQYLVVALEGQQPDGLSLFTIQLNKGAAMGAPPELGGGFKRVLPMFRGGGQDVWPDFHIGCAKAAPYCVISTAYLRDGGSRNPTDQTAFRRTPHLSEIIVMRDNGAEFRRLAQHRSVEFRTASDPAYWGKTRACISPDGSYVLADSNFGTPDAQRVIVVDTGFGKTRIRAAGSVFNTASLEGAVAPGSLATLQGENLAQCRGKGDFPLPTSLCSTTVNLNGIDARLVSVAPEQVDFLVPGAIQPDANVSVAVWRGPTGEDADGIIVPASSVAVSAPAIFSEADEDGSLRARVFASDWSARALKPGEMGVAFATGLGRTTPPIEEGQAPPATEPLARVEPLPELYVNDARQTLLYAGLAPWPAGIYQINFLLDPSTEIREQNQIWLRINGVESARRSIRLER